VKNRQKAFLIPAYNPGNELIDLVRNIRKRTSKKIFIVDDGSYEKIIFEKLKLLDIPELFIIEHSINLGKGAALKTAFNRILTEHLEIDGVVTLDSDGQHSVEDCFRILEQLDQNPNGFILGYRSFTRNIPLKSYLGNNISKLIYGLAIGYRYKDTQTGLRGLSRNFMKMCLSIKSNRFEFETEQLALAASTLQGNDIIEIPIETIYIHNNETSSFRPLVDSFRIYFVLLRYCLASLVTAATDFVVFFVAFSLGLSVPFANILARTASIGVQFTLLNSLVFKTRANFRNFMWFVSYVYGMGIISSWAQLAFVEHGLGSYITAKFVIEGVLFLVNFAFLRSYIFLRKRNAID